MILVRLFSIFLTFIAFKTVCGKSTCSHNVTECMTIGARNIYSSLVAGVKDVTEPIDPMHIDKIDAEFPGLKYQATNVSLNGLKNCAVESFKSDELSSDFELNLHCPKVVYIYHYDVKGTILTSIDLDGKGYANVALDDYYIKIKGKFKKFISEKDQKSHVSVISHFIETDLKGALKFECDSLINPDKAKSDLGMTAINENSKGIELILRSPILESFVTLLVQKLNTYFEKNPADELFPKPENSLF